MVNSKRTVFQKAIGVMLAVFTCLSFSLLTGLSGITANAAATDMPYFYYEFDDSERLAYDAVRDGALAFKKTVEVSPALSKASMNRIAGAIMYYDPETFGVKSVSFSAFDSKSVFNITYRVTAEQFTKQVTALNKRADSILTKASAQKSEYSKLLSIHNAITSGATVSTSTDLSSMVNALVGGKANSFGYAKAFAYLAGKAGIQTLVNIGYKDDTSYAWNKVYYGGNWYNIDCAGDDSTARFTDNVTYSLFMVSDDSFAEYTPLTTYFTSPDATSNNAYYYKMVGLEASSDADARMIIIKRVEAVNSSQKSTFSFAFTSDDALKSFVKTVSGTSFIVDTLDTAGKKCKNPIITDAADFIVNYDTRTVTIAIFYPDTELSSYYTDISDFTVSQLEYYYKLGLKIDLPFLTNSTAKN